MIEWLIALLVIMGCLFCLLAAVGLVRLPDTLIRMHAATKAGTLGAGLILAAVAVFFRRYCNGAKGDSCAGIFVHDCPGGGAPHWTGRLPIRNPAFFPNLGGPTG